MSREISKKRRLKGSNYTRFRDSGEKGPSRPLRELMTLASRLTGQIGFGLNKSLALMLSPQWIDFYTMKLFIVIWVHLRKCNLYLLNLRLLFDMCLPVCKLLSLCCVQKDSESSLGLEDLNWYPTIFGTEEPCQLTETKIDSKSFWNIPHRVRVP